MNANLRGKGLSLWRVLLFIFVLLLIAGGTSLFFGRRGQESFSAIERYAYYLEQNQIKLARSVYYEELFGDIQLQDEAEALAIDALDTIQEEFRQIRISYEQAEGAIRALEQSGIYIPGKKIEEAYKKIAKSNESKLSYEAGRTAWAEGDYLKSADAYARVERTDPYYTMAQEGMKRSLGAYRDVLIAEAKALSDAGEYLGSVQILEAGLLRLPEDESLVDAYGEGLSLTDDRYRQSMIEQARQAADTGDLTFSLHILNTARSYLEDLLEESGDIPAEHALRQANLQTDIRLLTTEASRIRAMIQNDAATDVDSYLAAGQYLQALASLDEATSLLPDSSALKAKEAELSSKLRYTFGTYIDLAAELAEQDPGIALLVDWRANFGDQIMELYPAPTGFGAEALAIQYLLPAANRFETNLEWEFDQERLQELGIDPGSLTLEVWATSADRELMVSLDSDTIRSALTLDLVRSEPFRIEAKLLLDGERLDSEDEQLIRSQRAVRLFLVDSAFVNDGELNSVDDYRAYQAELAERQKESTHSDWRGLIDLSLLPSDTLTDESHALLIPQATDLVGERHRDVYLFSSQTEQTLGWASADSFRALRVRIAWLDKTSVSTGLLQQLFAEETAAVPSAYDTATRIRLVVFADSVPLATLLLDAERLSDELEILLPFDADEFSVVLVSDDRVESNWSFVLDAEVAP